MWNTLKEGKEMPKFKFNENFLEVAQSPQGIGLERALDLICLEGGPISMMIEARVLLTKKQRDLSKLAKGSTHPPSVYD